MSLLFIVNCLNGIFYWINGKRIIFYTLLQQDIVILLLLLILIYEVKRWNRLKGK